MPRSGESMIDLSAKTVEWSPVLDGVGIAVGSGVDAPAKPLFSFERMGVSRSGRKISGSGSVYGRSSMR
jgi:hypothetical protein